MSAVIISTSNSEFREFRMYFNEISRLQLQHTYSVGLGVKKIQQIEKRLTFIFNKNVQFIPVLIFYYLD